MKVSKGRVPKNKLTQEEFVKRCREKHGDFYNYSKVVYEGLPKHIIVSCPKHGNYSVIAGNHVRGDKCLEFYNDRRGLQTRKGHEYFVNKVNNKFTGRIVHHEGEILTNLTYVNFKCNKHNHVFESNIAIMIRNGGCNLCKTENIIEKARYKREEWLKEFIKNFAHIDVLSIRTCKEKSEFFCQNHQENFTDTLDHVKQKKWIGCKICVREKINENLYSKSQEYALERLRSSDTYFNYDFSKSVYKGFTQPIEIFCKEHGAYLTGYNHRLKGSGYGECQVCVYNMNRRKLLVEFVDKAYIIHGDKFDYSYIKDYTNCKDNVPIYCKQCDEIFYQTPDNHLQNKGCPACNSISVYSKRLYVEHAIKNYDNKINLYLIKVFNNNEEFFKVGVTMKTLNERFGSAVHMPYDFTEQKFLTLDAKSAVEKETEFHKLLKEYHYIPDMPFGGHLTECFSVEGFDKAKEMFNNLKLEVIKE